MPDDPLQQVLRLVDEGRLTAEEAAPILDALEARSAGAGEPPRSPAGSSTARTGEPRFARIEVFERGRSSVDLRVPLAVGRMALSAIPGLSSGQAAEIREAVSRGLTGPIVDIRDDDGDGVRIVLE